MEGLIVTRVRHYKLASSRYRAHERLGSKVSARHDPVIAAVISRRKRSVARVSAVASPLSGFCPADFSRSSLPRPFRIIKNPLRVFQTRETKYKLGGRERSRWRLKRPSYKKIRSEGESFEETRIGNALILSSGTAPSRWWKDCNIRRIDIWVVSLFLLLDWSIALTLSLG